MQYCVGNIIKQIILFLKLFIVKVSKKLNTSREGDIHKDESTNQSSQENIKLLNTQVLNTQITKLNEKRKELEGNRPFKHENSKSDNNAIKISLDLIVLFAAMIVCIVVAIVTSNTDFRDASIGIGCSFVSLLTINKILVPYLKHKIENCDNKITEIQNNKLNQNHYTKSESKTANSKQKKVRFQNVNNAIKVCKKK